MHKGPVIQCAQCGDAVMHQNGLSIGPSAVFGMYGSARCADVALKIRSISPPRKSNPI